MSRNKRGVSRLNHPIERRPVAIEFTDGSRFYFRDEDVPGYVKGNKPWYWILDEVRGGYVHEDSRQRYG